MLRSIFTLGAIALAATSGAALAQQGGQPPARAPQLELALEAAQAALAACAKDGVKGAASVVDSAGALRLLLTADGAGSDQAEISRKKAATAVALKAVTSEVADKMEKDPAFKAKIEADKTLFPRPGGLLLMVGNDRSAPSVSPGPPASTASRAACATKPAPRPAWRRSRRGSSSGPENAAAVFQKCH